MGFLRLLLAFFVVIEHTSGPISFLKPLPGICAVQLFYGISGFYMSMIITEKYLNRKYLFYSNRFLRLYPIYWCVLILFVVYFLFLFIIGKSNIYMNSFSNVLLGADAFDYTIVIALLISNILFIGLDWSKFIGIDFVKNKITATSHWSSYSPSTSNFIPNAPAWTIGLELTFYFLVPFINRFKTNILIILILGSFFMRYLFYANGFFSDPFSYRFFPFEISFFILGMLAYRFWVSRKTFIESVSKSVVRVFLLGIVLYSVSFGLLPIPFFFKALMFYVSVFALLPFLFSVFKNNKIDRFLGEFSYPVYISHWFLIVIFKDFNIQIITTFQTITFCAYTFVLSYVIWFFIGRYVEKIRQARIKL